MGEFMDRLYLIMLLTTLCSRLFPESVVCESAEVAPSECVILRDAAEVEDGSAVKGLVLMGLATRSVDGDMAMGELGAAGAAFSPSDVAGCPLPFGCPSSVSRVFVRGRSTLLMRAPTSVKPVPMRFK